MTSGPLLLSPALVHAKRTKKHVGRLLKRLFGDSAMSGYRILTD